MKKTFVSFSVTWLLAKRRRRHRICSTSVNSSTEPAVSLENNPSVRLDRNSSLKAYFVIDGLIQYFVLQMVSVWWILLFLIRSACINENKNGDRSTVGTTKCYYRQDIAVSSVVLEFRLYCLCIVKHISIEQGQISRDTSNKFTRSNHVLVAFHLGKGRDILVSQKRKTNKVCVNY